MLYVEYIVVTMEIATYEKISIYFFPHFSLLFLKQIFPSSVILYVLSFEDTLRFFSTSPIRLALLLTYEFI
jgi:hypothetical protein